MATEAVPVTVEDMLAWIRAHGLEPNDVAEVTWSGRTIWHEDGAAFDAVIYETSPDGRRYLVPGTEDQVATYRRRIPMRFLPGDHPWAAESSSTPAPTTDGSTSPPPSG